MYQPTFSLVIPNYNDADCLPKAIDAMLNQSKAATEIIIVDDGSTDGSVELIQEYEAKYKNLKLIQHEYNQGIQAAIHTAVESATSDFIYLGAADDQILPGFIENAFELASAHPDVGIIFGDINITDEKGNPLGACRASKLESSGWVSPERFLNDYVNFEGPQHSQCSGTMYRKDAFVKWGGYRPELGHWCDTFISQVLGLQYGACYINEAVASWTAAEGTYSQTALLNPHIRFKVIENAAQLMRDDTYKNVFPTQYVSHWQKRAYQEVIDQSAHDIFQACRELNECTSVHKLLIIGKCHPHWVQYFQRYADCEIDYICQSTSHPFAPELESIAQTWDAFRDNKWTSSYDLILVTGEKIGPDDPNWDLFTKTLQKSKMVFLSSPGNPKLLNPINDILIRVNYVLNPNLQAQAYAKVSAPPSALLRHSHFYVQPQEAKEPDVESIEHYQAAFETMTESLTQSRKKFSAIQNACFQGPNQILKFSGTQIQEVEGFGYKLKFKTHLGQFLLETGLLNDMIIYEDGKDLPIEGASPETIIESGLGRYCIENGQILFSTTDNSDPQINGRTYSIYVPSALFLLENLNPEMQKKMHL